MVAACFAADRTGGAANVAGSLLERAAPSDDAENMAHLRFVESILLYTAEMQHGGTILFVPEEMNHDDSRLKGRVSIKYVLSSTRLLIDSPAGRDPQMRALFTDLELVLAQIVQLSGTPLQASERELIDRAMRDRDLLPRLRSAVPAGSATS